MCLPSYQIKSEVDMATGVSSCTVPDIERSMTMEQIKKEASQSRFYSDKQHQWKALHWIEKVVRRIFSRICCFVDSPQSVCFKRSFAAISKMQEAPLAIKERIQDLFLDALKPTNPAHRTLEEISLIYCNNHAAENHLYIHKPGKRRLFELREEGSNKLLHTASNVRYGVIHFRGTDGEKRCNRYDSLWDETDHRIGAVTLSAYYSKQRSAIKVYTGEDRLLMKADMFFRNKSLLVFRDVTTNKVQAVCRLENPQELRWSITLTDPESLSKLEIKPVTLFFAVLKHAQHYHFLSPYDRWPYAKES